MSIQIRVVSLVASAIIASAASAQTAVEWKVSEGGNGHWYEVRSRTSPLDFWTLEQQLETELQAHLATISNGAEDNFIWSTFQPGWAYLGGYQDPLAPNFSEPAGGWRWVTGEPFAISPVPWARGEPNNGSTINVPSENFLGYHGPCCWNDAGNPGLAPNNYVWTYVIEWDADCNGDGIIDYGQFLRGELIDLNSNGVPDICETSISSVIPPSVPSQGGSTITIRGNFPPNPTVKVGGVVATNVNRVSVTQITATVPALLPGMASVQVNDFMLPDAIYIRPECGSDLDQNGVVDTADIAIILLDFGPCYEPPSTIAAPAPTPLLLPDATAPAPTPPAPQSARPAPPPHERSS